MKEQSKNTSDEIDLFDLFKMIKRGFESVGNLFLRLISFFLRNAIVLIILIVIGAVIGYFWNKNTVTYYQTDSIIFTDFEGATYLYKRVEELNFQFSIEDEDLKNQLNMKNLSKISLKVVPIYFSRELSEGEEAYLEYLEEAKSIGDEERDEAFKNSMKTHKLTLYHPSDVDSKALLHKILEHLRENDYFRELYRDQAFYITEQIESNKKFIASLDRLISNYSDNDKKTDDSNRVVVNGANFDFDGLISRRSQLQREMKLLIQVKIKNQEFLKVIDEGSPRKLEETKLKDRNKMILAPLILILLFFIGLFAKNIIVRTRNLERKKI